MYPDELVLISIHVGLLDSTFRDALRDPPRSRSCKTRLGPRASYSLRKREYDSARL